ncbi:hypothetical protein CCUS01_14673 [Colletotrichum cuscutae]|uniref:Uncharacterized protein n=1 Tax=Colletotrichum cuscutae TaxID=1209917 RepID=A0AAJ0DKM6_9PEZI|nr:hypothetical protein CCUS01_14673 [Colletotrichum cuscutae]
MSVCLMPPQNIQSAKPLPADPTRIRPLLSMHRSDMARKMLRTMIAASTSGTLVESLFLTPYFPASYHRLSFSKSARKMVQSSWDIDPCRSLIDGVQGSQT